MTRPPWFDTGYYLEANGDVASLGLNPLWHYLTSGRLEGRAARRPGGMRRSIIDAAADTDVITAGYSRAAAGPKLSRTWLEKRLQGVCAAAKGLALSISHDCYIRVTGGIQFCIADEQAVFAGQGIAYLHLSPLQPLLRLAEPGEAGQMYNLVLGGAFLGIASQSDPGRRAAQGQAAQGRTPELPGPLRIGAPRCLPGGVAPGQRERQQRVLGA